MMKLLLPAIAAVLIGLVVTWPQLQMQSGQFSMGYATVESAEGEPPRMLNARFTGIDNKSRPYLLTADSATQMGDSPEIVTLRNPQADITLADGSWLALSAESGVYSENNHILGLRGSVNMYHDSGYEFHTDSADLDIAAATASGGAPVSGQGPFGEIASQGFLILNRGERIIFTGRTHLIISPKTAESRK